MTSVIYFSIIVIFLLVNQYANQNFGDLISRIKNLISRVSVYRLFRIAFFSNLIFLYFKWELFYRINLTPFGFAFENFLFNDILDNYKIYLIGFAGFLFLTYFLRQRAIRENFGYSPYIGQGYKVISIYCFFWMTYIALFLGVYFFTFSIISWLNSYLILNGFNLFDFLPSFSPVAHSYSNYHKGFYISVLASLSVFVLFSNALYKRIYHNHTIIDIVIYIIVLIVFAFGVFSGLFSVINYIINYHYGFTPPSWKDSDKLLGYFSVRLTSIILAWSIIKFMFQTIFRGKILKPLISTVSISRIDDIEDRRMADFTGIRANYYDIYYFCQVGFYILNTFVAEYLVSNSLNSGPLTFLLAILPIFVDDYLAIHVYYKRGQAMDVWHFTKKHLFNIAMLFISTLSLYNSKTYILLSVYLTISILITLIYISNLFSKQAPVNAF